MKPDPYRLFFPIGIALGLAGVSIWPLYVLHVVGTYSGRAHALVQTDGFLYAFIAGFLLTAVPRFTGTDAPGRCVQYVLATAVVAACVASDLQAFALGTAIFLGAHLLLMGLVAARFVQRQQNPPPTFALIGLGLVAGLAGAALNAGVASELVDPRWDLLGKRLMTEGMVLLLVLGVGGFLGPRLLGFAALPQFAASGPGGRPSSAIGELTRDWRWTAAGLAILASLVADYGYGVTWAALVRAAVVTAVILFTVRVWQKPAVRTTLSWCVWTANWLVVAAVWLVALAPKYRVDFLHVLFIGGFSLMILAVATRVTLSHGGHDLHQEQRSWPLRLGLTFGLVAMIARIGAPFAAATYFEHLAFAGVLWIAGILLWGVYILKRLA